MGEFFGGEGDFEVAEEQVMRMQLEKLVGKVVKDSAGKKIGRLEEVICDREGMVQEYVSNK